MLRLPAVSGRFYPSNPAELNALILQYTSADKHAKQTRVEACLVSHAGYVSSGRWRARCMLDRFPKRILILGVRRLPRGEMPRLDEGAWRHRSAVRRLMSRWRELCALLARCYTKTARHIALNIRWRCKFPFCGFWTGIHVSPIALRTVRFEDLVPWGKRLDTCLRLAAREYCCDDFGLDRYGR